MGWIVKEEGSYQLSQSPAGTDLTAQLSKVAHENSTDIAEWLAASIDDPIWKLELVKNALTTDIETAAAAYLLSKHQGDPSCLSYSKRLAVLSLLRQGEESGSSFQPRLRHGFASAVAALFWVFSALRYRSDSDGFKPTEPVFAVHGERSNRTKHVIAAANEFENPTVLLLGRPKARRKSLNLPEHIRMVRPIDFRSTLQGIRPAIRHLRQGRQVVETTGISLSFKELVAIGFRVFQGHAHQAWVARHVKKPIHVVMGHTGLADTSLLEKSVQAKGGRTTHFVHGASVGWKFAGLSSQAIWTSATDAKAHAKLFGYEQCLALPDTPSAPAPVSKNLVVFTNYLHPSHPSHPKDSLAAELALIQLIASARDAQRDRFGEILWVLHPAHAQIDGSIVAQAKRSLEDAGISLLSSAEASQSILQTHMVLTTPSTIALDALRSGRVPIILKTYPERSDSVSMAFPHVVEDAQGLRDALEELQNEARHSELLQALQKEIGPSRTPRPSDWDRFQP